MANRAQGEHAVDFGIDTEPPGVMTLAIRAAGVSVIITARRRQFAALAATLTAVANAIEVEQSAELTFRRTTIEVTK